MLFRFTKLFMAVGLLVALWGLSTVRRPDSGAWVRPVDTPPGPVRILQFYASVGVVTPGEKALLCYGVENAKSVRIAPMIQGVYPAYSRCLEIVPEHTTHYTILAEGYDGTVAMKSFTLPVQGAPGPMGAPPPKILNYAKFLNSRRRAATFSTAESGINGHNGSDRISRHARSATGRSPRFMPQS